MRRAVCLQHVPFEGPGHLAQALAARGFELEKRVVPTEGLPADAGDFLLVMGGPMSANDADGWIAGELAFIRNAVERGTPYLGVCLGSQMLAKALGGRVYAGAEPEIGMITVDLTDDGRRDPVFARLPPRCDVFAWHGEGIEAPAGAARLAGSARFPVQAFRCGPRAYGLLFHVEIDSAGIDALCRECAADLARAGRSAADVKADAARHVDRLHGYADLVIQALTA
jgi:GMP synthase-like glutamine amidotransferase